MVVARLDLVGLTQVLSIVAHGSQAQRLSLVRLEEETRTFFSDVLDPTTRSSGADVIRAHACLAALMRTLWNLVPQRVFSAGSPDFRSLAHAALRRRFGQGTFPESTASYLAVVFKRIRQYALTGRHASSLDLELQSHRHLLDVQAGRCNHCRYEFNAELYHYLAEEEGVAADSYEPRPGEVYFPPVYRRPELDHIVPVLLGGDNNDNWQILCASCNRGKSDLLVYFGGFQQTGAGRMSDLFAMSTGKRFAVISETPSQVSTHSGDGKFFRVFRANPDGFLNRENLVARYE